MIWRMKLVHSRHRNRRDPRGRPQRRPRGRSHPEEARGCVYCSSSTPMAMARSASKRRSHRRKPRFSETDADGDGFDQRRRGKHRIQAIRCPPEMLEAMKERGMPDPGQTFIQNLDTRRRRQDQSRQSSSSRPSTPSSVMDKRTATAVPPTKKQLRIFEEMQQSDAANAADAKDAADNSREPKARSSRPGDTPEKPSAKEGRQVVILKQAPVYAGATRQGRGRPGVNRDRRR
jgi:hypothetical protein